MNFVHKCITIQSDQRVTAEPTVVQPEWQLVCSVLHLPYPHLVLRFMGLDLVVVQGPAVVVFVGVVAFLDRPSGRI